MNNELNRIIKNKYMEMRCETRLDDMDKYIQHGSCTTLQHSLGVAYLALYIHDACNMNCNRESLIKASLLHDYYLYDWHAKDKRHTLHGFSHPGISLKNASEDFLLNKYEIDAITKHMFPLIPKFPSYKESWLICLSDKLCTVHEMINKKPYRKLYQEIEEEIYK